MKIVVALTYRARTKGKWALRSRLVNFKTVIFVFMTGMIAIPEIVLVLADYEQLEMKLSRESRGLVVSTDVVWNSAEVKLEGWCRVVG